MRKNVSKSIVHSITKFIKLFYAFPFNVVESNVKK